MQDMHTQKCVLAYYISIAWNRGKVLIYIRL